MVSLFILILIVVLLAALVPAIKALVKRAIKLNAFKGAAFWLSGGLLVGIFILIGFVWGLFAEPKKAEPKKAEPPTARLLIDQSGSRDDTIPCKVPALR